MQHVIWHCILEYARIATNMACQDVEKVGNYKEVMRKFHKMWEGTGCSSTKSTIELCIGILECPMLA